MSTKADFQEGEFYHVYTRGVDQRDVFLEPAEKERFYQSMYLFNDKHYAHRGTGSLDKLLRLCFIETTGYDERDCFVDIVTFNLMTNHFHFVLVPLVENGVSLFMHKLLMGYSKSFNIKHSRRGSLFETYQAKHIDSQAYLDHLIIYAHLNGLDLFGLPWREGLVDDWDLALKKLDEHPYSGHHLAMGRTQKLPVVNEKYLKDFYRDQKDYQEHIKSWSTSSIPSPGDGETL